MKKPQVTTTTGISGILGIWLAVFGQSTPGECLDIMGKLNIQEWAHIIVPALVCAWGVFQDEDKEDDGS